MSFARPEMLLFALPLAYALYRLRDPRPVVNLLRALGLAALALALAQPHALRKTRGIDLLIVADRSESMPPGATARALEVVRLANEARTPGDRVGVVSFGTGASIEALPSSELAFAGFSGNLAAGQRAGSDLGEGLEAALELIPAQRPGRLLLLSDGESNGRDPLPAARRAFARGIPIDTLHLGRDRATDLAIERVDLPEEVSVGEPFQFTVWVRSDERATADYTVERRGRTISAGSRVFEGGGLSKLVFRDVLLEPGVGEYRVRLGGAGDAVPENDSALGSVRVTGPRVVLVLNDDGAEDLLVSTLRAAGLATLVRRPEDAQLDRIGLTAFRAVVIENVSAERLGHRGLVALDDFVVERGGGLLLTGGRASFGVGGYHRSPIDPILPVSMELRQEARKQAIALVIVLDRSGSMNAPAVAGLTKMDLANLGSVAAIELLSPNDSVGVIAVDSSPHIIQELVRVEDMQAISESVLKIGAGGGGIYTYTGLFAAGELLDEAEQTTRHVILFADAADAEQAEGVPDLLAQFQRMGISVSVIALGNPTDSDAQFLRDTASQGGGEVYFTVEPSELPRLFAQDTLMVARSSFVEQRTASVVLPDLFGLGRVALEGFPDLPGYNLTYLRPDAVAGVATTDDYRAPVFAFAYQGIGRTAAYTGQIGGEFGADFAAWDAAPEFLVTTLRWLVGQEEPGEYFASARREGRSARISVELDREAGAEAPAQGFTVRLQRPDGAVEELPLARVGPDRYEALAELDEAGTVLSTVRLDGQRFLSLPPLSLPYSPEFERPFDPRAGERLLRRLASESGGEPLTVVGSFFGSQQVGRAVRGFARELVWLALLLLLAEIAVRRLGLFAQLRAPLFARRAWRRLCLRAARPAAAAARGRELAGPASGSAQPQVDSPSAASAAPRPGQGSSMADALSKARSEARKKLGG